MDIENKLREILLPVFELESIEEIQPDQSLIKDLGADSLDFVEILFLIERNFNIVITAQEIMLGGMKVNAEELFTDSLLTDNGLKQLLQNFPERTDKLKVGMSKIELFSLITVRDLASLIQSKIQN
jgi:acyl carrier protein